MADSPKPAHPDPREMYTEIAGLVGAIAKAFVLPESDVIAAIERQAIALEFGQDANGNRFVLAALESRSVRIYQGAIKRDALPAD